MYYDYFLCVCSCGVPLNSASTGEVQCCLPLQGVLFHIHVHALEDHCLPEHTGRLASCVIIRVLSTGVSAILSFMYETDSDLIFSFSSSAELSSAQLSCTGQVDIDVNAYSNAFIVCSKSMHAKPLTISALRYRFCAVCDFPLEVVVHHVIVFADLAPNGSPHAQFSGQFETSLCIADIATGPLCEI